MSYRLEQDGDILRIDLNPRLQWPAWLLYSGLLVLVGAAVITSLPDPPSTGITVLALLILAPFLFFVTYRESLVATSDVLRIEHRTLGFLPWSQQYSIADVNWFGCAEEDWSEDETWAVARVPIAIGGGIQLADGKTYRVILGCGRRQLAFGIGSRTHWAGPGLRTDDAAAIAEAVRSWIRAHQQIADSN